MAESDSAGPIGLHVMAGLTGPAASGICMSQCKAMCCRGALILQLTPDEVDGFKEQASKLGVEAQVAESADGGGWVRFADHPGEHCPMLDNATSACRIYQDRPRRCREFPEKLTPGCAISGWTSDS